MTPDETEIIGTVRATREEIARQSVKMGMGWGIVCPACFPTNSSELLLRNKIEVYRSDLPHASPNDNTIRVVHCVRCRRSWNPFTLLWEPAP